MMRDAVDGGVVETMGRWDLPSPPMRRFKWRQSTGANHDERRETLRHLYALCREEQIDDALDFLYEKIDDLLLAERYDECDEYLREVDLSQLHDDVLVGLLTITLAARGFLKERASMFAQIEAHLRKEMDSAEVEATLRGLD